MKTDEKKLVIERLKLMPQGRRLHICERTYDREGLIDEVMNETQDGEFVVEVYMNAIRFLKKEREP